MLRFVAFGKEIAIGLAREARGVEVLAEDVGRVIERDGLALHRDEHGIVIGGARRERAPRLESGDRRLVEHHFDGRGGLCAREERDVTRPDDVAPVEARDAVVFATRADRFVAADGLAQSPPVLREVVPQVPVAEVDCAHARGDAARVFGPKRRDELVASHLGQARDRARGDDAERVDGEFERAVHELRDVPARTRRLRRRQRAHHGLVRLDSPGLHRHVEIRGRDVILQRDVRTRGAFRLDVVREEPREFA